MGEFIRDRLPDPVSYFEAEGLKLQGKGKWRTTECRFHGGSDSMRINLAGGGWCCMSCGVKGGDVLAYHIERYEIDFITAAKALGCWVDDGQPHRPQRPKPLPANQAIQVMGFEANLTAIAAANLAHGIQLSDRDRSRLLVAAGRIQTISRAYA